MICWYWYPALEQGVNLPSTPVTPNPSTRFWVSRNGTRSGVSNVLPWNSRQRLIGILLIEELTTFSKRQLKSTCTASPLLRSSRIFSQCLSPNLKHPINVSKKYLFPCWTWIVPQDEANHGHHRSSSTKGQSTCKPCWRFGECFKEPFVKHRRESGSGIRSGIRGTCWVTYIDRISLLNTFAASLSEISLIIPKVWPISEDYSWVVCEWNELCNEYVQHTHPLIPLAS